MKAATRQVSVTKQSVSDIICSFLFLITKNTSNLNFTRAASCAVQSNKLLISNVYKVKYRRQINIPSDADDALRYI